MKKLMIALLATAGLCGGAAWVAANADPVVGKDATATSGSVIYRASDLRGMAVRNAAGEDLGKVEDLVIDLKDGHIRYAVVSFGGFLGVGDKLFAVPFKALHMVGGKENKDWHMMLDVDKERLKNAPGFDKNNWPGFANSVWGHTDQFYTPRDDANERRVNKKIAPR